MERVGLKPFLWEKEGGKGRLFFRKPATDRALQANLTGDQLGHLWTHEVLGLKVVYPNADNDQSPDDQNGREGHGARGQEHISRHQDAHSHAKCCLACAAHFGCYSLDFFVLIRHEDEPPAIGQSPGIVAEVPRKIKPM